MPNDRPVSRKTSWKQDDGAASRKPVRGWQKDRDTGPARPARPKRPRKLLWAALGLLVCCSLIIGLIILLSPPKPARLVIVGASYADNLAIPHNAYGLHDVNELFDLSRLKVGLLPFWRSQPIRALLQRPVKLEGPDWRNEWQGWQKEIARVEEAGDLREPTVIVFLALHGGSDGEEAYLLADDDEANRLPIADVLGAMAKLPREKQKLLILDATQITDDWSLGMLHNDFARGLKGKLAEIQKGDGRIENLWVLAASDEDQRSWIDVDGGRSVFSRAVVEGLRGEADRDGDGRINLRELYEYVGPEVKAWVSANRGDVQEAILLPAADDKALDLAAAVELSYYKDKADAARRSPGQAGAGATAAGSSKLWWDKYKALRDGKPGPATYAPHLWRRFKAALIRHDQLLAARCSEPNKLTNLEADLRGLEGRIRDACGPLPELVESRYSTLTMAGARGEVIPEDDPDRETFGKLLSKPEAQFSAAWDEMIGGRVNPDLKARFNADLMDRLAGRGQGQGPDVGRVAHLLRRYSNGPLRPAEVHFLLMAEAQLQRMAPGPQPRPELVRRAVGVRRLAEEAALAILPGGYSYSEELVAWIRAGVGQADRERRRGEDLLFATDAAHWEEAKQALDMAESGYEQARVRAAAVREALEVRNRVLDELPDYTQWWARRISVVEEPLQADGPGPIPGDEEFTGSLESLWEKVHRLAGRLESPSETADLAPLTNEVKEVHDGFVAVERRFLHDLEDVDRSPLPKDWVPEVALAVPFVGSDGAPRAVPDSFPDRDQLPSPVRAGQGPAPDDTSGADAAKREVWVKGRAVTQGRLALAVLGERTFDDEALGKGLIRYDDVLATLKAARERPDWWKPIAYAGHNVGARWGRMPGAVEERLAEGVDKGKDKANAAASEAPLRAADRLARQLTGTAAIKKAPAGEVRKRRMHDLLVWMAGRTLEDHWFGEPPKVVPYYREAGLNFAKDAKALVPESRAVEEIERELIREDALKIEGPKDVVWTSEPRMELSYEVRTSASARVSPGTVAVWGEPGDASIEQVDPTAGSRSVLDVGGPTPVRYTLRSPLLEDAEAAAPRKPDVRPTSFLVRGYFRGQAPEFVTNVRLHPAPDSTLIDPPEPPRGSVTVRSGDDVLGRFGDNNAAVTIVLDASGSMGEERTRARLFKDTYRDFSYRIFNDVSSGRLPLAKALEALVGRLRHSKYREATEAIDGILRKIPKGTKVSLWVFGKAVGPLPPTRTPAAWETIERVQEPVTWDPEDRAQHDEVMRKIRPPALLPYYATPIVGAMLRAKEDLKDAAGFKTLVVLTDGGESEEKPPERIWRILRKEFPRPGITINMVCFKADAEEQKKAEFQFKGVLDELGGKFQLANDAPALAQKLRDGIARNLTFRVDKIEHVPAATSGRVPELPVVRLNHGEAWHPLLNAGHFRVVVDAIPLKSPIQVNGGDRLLLRLIEAKGGGVQFARDLYAREPIFRSRRRVEQNGWLLAVLQNKLEGDRTLNMTVTLEKLFDPAERELEQIEPKEVWMEVEPAQVGEGVVGLRWGGREEYPAAAWGLEVPEWPEDADGNPVPARLRAWWDKDAEAPDAARLERAGKDFDNPLDIRGRKVEEGGVDIVIESITIEDRRVPGEPDGPVSCLVVRASHAPGKPIWVRPKGISPDKAQHRFYSHAGRYTGVFWPLNEDQVREELDAIEVVSVEAFRKLAEARGDFIEIGEGGKGGLVPDPDDRGLLRPIAIAQ